ncbi:MAG: WYL domain-containing protein [Desulfotomaculaceae bacterium]|nr:WYL domain-containing protein [Desulfotomaculaceae bacterium]
MLTIFCLQNKAPIYPGKPLDLEFGRDSFTKQPDGRLLFSFRFADRDNILSWILTFGNGAELLEPVEFREELYRIGKIMHEKYRDS